MLSSVKRTPPNNNLLCNHPPQQASQSLSLRLFPPLKRFERRGHLPDVYEIYFNAAPADVALVSPQTPLIPPFRPSLSGGYSKPYPWIPFCFRACCGFFASSLAIIRLNKLTTLSLRDIPPLNPFERRDHLPDIHEIFVCIAIYPLICIAPLVDRSKAQVIRGELAGKARLRGFFSHLQHPTPVYVV